jgi:hypothetical protein
MFGIVIELVSLQIDYNAIQPKKNNLIQGTVGWPDKTGWPFRGE